MAAVVCRVGSPLLAGWAGRGWAIPILAVASAWDSAAGAELVGLPTPTVCPVETPCPLGERPRPCSDSCGLGCGCEACPPCPAGEDPSRDANACRCMAGMGGVTTTPTPTATPTASPRPSGGCVGDCDRNGDVTVDELLTMVNEALGDRFSNCLAGDVNGDRAIDVSEIIAAVRAALNSCRRPEGGYCYESAGCFPSDTYPSRPFSTDRGSCCRLARTEGSVPFSWCPGDQVGDPTSEPCAQCLYPC